VLEAEIRLLLFDDNPMGGVREPAPAKTADSCLLLDKLCTLRAPLQTCSVGGLFWVGRTHECQKQSNQRTQEKGNEEKRNSAQTLVAGVLADENGSKNPTQEDNHRARHVLHRELLSTGPNLPKR